MQFSKILFIISVLIILTISTNATVWTVDSNPANNAADFTTLQAAHDGAASGDTLYLSGFNISYGNAVFAKTLYVFGPGYYLNENDSTQANPFRAITGYISFQTGSNNSVVTGCDINCIDIHVDYITIKRNRVIGNYAIDLYNDVDFVNIIQNYIPATYNAINLNGTNHNINIANNFISASTATSHNCLIGRTNCSNIIIENNILYGEITLYNAVISNNIFRDGTYTGDASNVIQNNICNAMQFDTTGQNQQNVVMSTVFVASGTSDGQWQIDPFGPAAGAGTYGTDIGMFGGNTPYVLSGIPEIPTVYFFYGPSNASQTLQIQAKIKSRR
jgi:hypothetical protein